MKTTFSISRFKLAGAIVAAAILTAQGPAFSQAKKEQPAPAGASGVMSTATASVDGFRSAKFGMSEAEVKGIIAKEFNLKGDAIREQPNAGERTKALLIKVHDLLPGGGTAEVSYIFGYQTKKLIQVSVSWSKAIDDKMTPEQLFSNSSVLRSHFLSEGFKPESIATNMPLNNGLLMFRGSDAKDRTTMMILQGTFSQGENNQRILTPTALMLFYIADAKAPDIYRLPPGSF
ncbi:MAG: hypothetical protein JSR61_06310 [Proteobacteria bacterium]|nr:hypothetical protein [Pseudomonadota bacterium]